ncbi:MAG: phosphodiester glycosidase family protein [Firmicutes bacterium]|nr:phosphodiester glycosidase family protein [Bacillota bacterium]
MKKSNSRSGKVLKYVLRSGLVFLTLLLAVIISLYTVMFILVNGPSDTARTLFVRSVMETSAGKFLAHIYLSSDEIAEITAGSGGDDVIDESSYEKIDSSLIHIPTAETTEDDISQDDMSETTSLQDEKGAAVTDDAIVEDEIDSQAGNDESGDTTESTDGIEVVDIQGSTYYGKMIIVSDPSRVKVATLENYGEGYSGMTLAEFVEFYGALGGINAGGFEDQNGTGTGAVPDGIVIRDGEIIWGEAETYYKCVVGFDSDNILHVGNMTGAQALEDGIIDALSFAGGPLLIVNGKAQNTSRNLGGGLNPRTAIGQRSDGAILLLVINGRKADSLGATYDDLVKEMLKYGAVNAANLDGGSSSLMIYDGEYITTSSYLLGDRNLPNAFIFY